MDFFVVSPRLQEPAPFLKAFEQTVKLADAHGFRGVLLFDGGQVSRLFGDLRSAAVSAVLLDLPPSEVEYAHLSRAFEVSPDPTGV